MLPARFLSQRTHLTCPATVWKYVEGACTRSEADLVMVDLEDSVPQGDHELLERGRENAVRAFQTLDWGPRLRFFRPRGRDLDPQMEDVRAIVTGAGRRIEGLVYPKVESVDEVRELDVLLGELEREQGIEAGTIRVALLIESVSAEEQAFAIAAASPRLCALILGAFDYWSSLGMTVPYRYDHPMMDAVRMRIAKAAAFAGVPAIAEMSTNYPTKDKSEEERRAAIDDCRRHALHAKELGFRGKWVGIPAQVAPVNEVFTLGRAEVERALDAVTRFREAERRGLGATMIDGAMADRATDRMHRVTLQVALRQGLLDEATARALDLR